jgi:hypothetical protein
MFEAEILSFGCPFVDELIVIFKHCRYGRIVLIFETNIH